MFYLESLALFLHDESFYQTHTSLFSTSISSKQQLKPKIEQILHYLKDAATKYLIISTENCKVILPGW